MTDEPETEEQRREAELMQQHRDLENTEAETFRDETETLPFLLVGVIPALIFGGVFLSALGLKSHWWWTGIMAIPVIGLLAYPFLLRGRMKTPLRLTGGRLVTGREKWRLLALGFLAVIALQLLKLAYSTLLAG